MPKLVKLPILDLRRGARGASMRVSMFGVTTRQSLGMPLVALICVAAVANLNLSVANVALPSIGDAFDASQTALNMIAIGFSLGLATTVLYLGALGDRYGRKGIMLLGIGLSIPACLLAAYAPNEWVLAVARFCGGVAAGMAFPTTLALITAIWSGDIRTRAIALWSAVGGGITALGPLVSGALLEYFWWGSVFLVTLPLAVIAFLLAVKFVPGHLDESTEPVDNLSGVLSIVMVAALVVGINFAPLPGALPFALALLVVTVIAGWVFVTRQKRIPNPLYDLSYAQRRIFWVAALGGIIVFGSLMASMFIGQQYLQNVLGLPSLAAGAIPLPLTFGMIAVAGLSAKLVDTRGSRFTLLAGFGCFLVAFLMMLVLWTETTGVAAVLVTYLVAGVGVGLAGTPASHCLTSAVPVKRAGMASATADLQRDLGGAIMQAIFGALLTAGYAYTFTSLASQASPQVSDDVMAELTKSYSSAAATAQQYPQYSQEIITAARESFLAGANWAYAAGVLFVLSGAAVVFFLFPKKEKEEAMIAAYQKQDRERVVPA